MDKSAFSKYGDYSYPNHPEMGKDFTVTQGYENYSDDDHAIWSELLTRQMDILPGRACNEFMEALNRLFLS